MKSETDPPKQPSTKLTDITRGLYHAASTTYSMMANQYINLLQQYFDKTQDGSYVAKSVEVQLPDESRVKVPLISMVSPKGLMLDKVNFDFSVLADPNTLADASHALDGIKGLTRSSFKVEMASKTAKDSFWGKGRKQGQVHVNLEFKSIDPPEGLMRMFDKYAANVTPLHPMKQPGVGRKLLSPRFEELANIIDSNTKVLKPLIQFNPKEYNAIHIRERHESLKAWEDQLQKHSLLVDHHLFKVKSDFEQTFEYARIAFEDTEDYIKLRLNNNLSDQAREWINQAVEFYKTLQDDDKLIFQLSQLKDPGASIEVMKKQWSDESEKIHQVVEFLQKYDEFKADDGIYKRNKSWLSKFEKVSRLILESKPDALALLFPESEFLNK